MKFYVKIIHKLVSALCLEEIIITKAQTNKSYLKFIPLHHQFNPLTLKKVFRNKAVFNLDISDYMQWYIWAGLEDISWKKGTIETNGQLLDIGANVGAFTLKTLKNSTNLDVHAFEPNPIVFEKLKNNIKLNPSISDRCSLNMIGISNKIGELDFFWNKLNSGGGSFSVNEKNTIKESIEVTTIDDYVKINNLKKVKFIKIDVEGFEPQVLEGAIQTIRNQKPNFFIEVSPDWWSKNNYKAKNVLTIFEELNYRFFPVIDEQEQEEISLALIKNYKKQFNLYLTIR